MWQLHNGDCIQWLREQPSNAFDGLFTDPPYCSGGTFTSDRVKDSANNKYLNEPGTYPEFMGENKDQWSYFLWSVLWLSEAFRTLKSGAPFCVFIDWRQLPVLHAALQAAGFVLRGCVVWDKTRAARPQKGKFRHQSEFVLWGSRGPWQAATKDALPGVFTISALAGGKKLHTCGKPVELMKELLEVCPAGGVILDPFAGSASTGIAALETGRRFVGCEQSRDYYEIARERLAARAADRELLIS